MTLKGAAFWILTVLIVFVAQITFSNFIAVRGSFPNLMLLTVIFFGLYRGPVTGEILGFALGLLADSASISIFGSQTFMFTLIGFISGRLQGKINEEKPIAQMSLVFFMSLLYVAGLALLESLFGGSWERFRAGTSLYQTLYSTLISPLVFFALFQGYFIFHRSRLSKGELP